MSARTLAASLLAAGACWANAAAQAPATANGAPEPMVSELRVCADPNNLPFSNEREEGFENKLAQIVAEALGAELSYTWWAQRRGFIRNTLNSRECDVVMGVPAEDYDLVDTTRPYYRSTYVYVYPAASNLDLSSMRDPRLHELTIGVHVIGDDYRNPPPVHALGRLGIVDNVVGFTIYGDYREPSPPARLVEAVAAGQVDVAAVWGPTGGYFARRQPIALEVVPITDTEAFGPMPFEYSIAMGVRRGEHALRDTLDAVIENHRAEIRALLEAYGVPLVDAAALAHEETRP